MTGLEGSCLIVGLGEHRTEGMGRAGKNKSVTTTPRCGALSGTRGVWIIKAIKTRSRGIVTRS